MRILALAAILTMAASIVTPLDAADRPVGPETGQLRGNQDAGQPRGPDGVGAFDSRTFSGRSFGADAEIPWGGWWRSCYETSWSGNCGGSGF